MQPKQKLVAGLLGIFLGAWGIHQFYLGDNKKGVIRIVVTLVTCGIGGIWGFNQRIDNAMRLEKVAFDGWPFSIIFYGASKTAPGSKYSGPISVGPLYQCVHPVEPCAVEGIRPLI